MRTVLWGVVAATDALTFGAVILGLASVSPLRLLFARTPGVED
jgi:hypothetical protein